MSYDPQTIFVKITLLKLYVLNVYIYIYICIISVYNLKTNASLVSKSV